MYKTRVFYNNGSMGFRRWFWMVRERWVRLICRAFSAPGVSTSRFSFWIIPVLRELMRRFVILLCSSCWVWNEWYKNDECEVGFNSGSVFLCLYSRGVFIEKGGVHVLFGWPRSTNNNTETRDEHKTEQVCKGSESLVIEKLCVALIFCVCTY